MGRVICLLAIFLISNFPDIESYRNDLECLESKINEDSKSNSKIFFKSLKKMETTFQNQKMLNRLDKKGYNNFLKKIFSLSNNKSKILFNDVTDKVPEFSSFSLLMVFYKYKNCLIELYKNTDFNKDFLKNRFSKLKNLDFKGSNDYESLIQYTNSVDFKSKKDRLLLLSLYYNYLYIKSKN